MKFFFGIFVIAFVALATAEVTTRKPIVPHFPRPTFPQPPKPTETKTVTEGTNIRNKREFILSTYAPVAIPAAYAATPYAYGYTASAQFAYPTYRAYAPYPAYYI